MSNQVIKSIDEFELEIVRKRLGKLRHDEEAFVTSVVSELVVRLAFALTGADAEISPEEALRHPAMYEHRKTIENIRDAIYDVRRSRLFSERKKESFSHPENKRDLEYLVATAGEGGLQWGFNSANGLAKLYSFMPPTNIKETQLRIRNMLTGKAVSTIYSSSRAERALDDLLWSEEPHHHEAFSTVLRSIGEALNAQRAFLALTRQTDEKFSVAVSYPHASDQIVLSRMTPSTVSWSINQKMAVWSGNFGQDHVTRGIEYASVPGWNPESVMAIPLLANRGTKSTQVVCVGAIYFEHSAKNQFNEEDFLTALMIGHNLASDILRIERDKIRHELVVALLNPHSQSPGKTVELILNALRAGHCGLIASENSLGGKEITELHGNYLRDPSLEDSRTMQNDVHFLAAVNREFQDHLNENHKGGNTKRAFEKSRHGDFDYWESDPSEPVFDLFRGITSSVSFSIMRPGTARQVLTIESQGILRDADGNVRPYSRTFDGPYQEIDLRAWIQEPFSLCPEEMSRSELRLIEEISLLVAHGEAQIQLFDARYGKSGPVDLDVRGLDLRGQDLSDTPICLSELIDESEGEWVALSYWDDSTTFPDNIMWRLGSLFESWADCPSTLKKSIARGIQHKAIRPNIDRSQAFSDAVDGAWSDG